MFGYVTEVSTIRAGSKSLKQPFGGTKNVDVYKVHIASHTLIWTSDQFKYRAHRRYILAVECKCRRWLMKGYRWYRRNFSIL